MTSEVQSPCSLRSLALEETSPHVLRTLQQPQRGLHVARIEASDHTQHRTRKLAAWGGHLPTPVEPSDEQNWRPWAGLPSQGL